MSLTEKDKEEIKQMIDQALGLFNQNGKNVKQQSNQPDYESWKRNGIKSKLANIIIAPEDYFEGDKKFFTWDEAVAAQEKMPDGWRLPTRQEMVLMCEEFARPDPNDDYDPDLLASNLKLEKNGWICREDMDEYNKDPEIFDDIQDQGTNGNFWSVGSTSPTTARYLDFSGGYTSPEANTYKTYGFSVRLVRDAEFPEKGAK